MGSNCQTSSGQLSAARYAADSYHCSRNPCALCRIACPSLVCAASPLSCAPICGTDSHVKQDCCRWPQVLSDLCDVSGPFSNVLAAIKDELVRAIYSDYYSIEQQGLQFSQLPYFKAAERLEADNKHLQQEKEVFRKVLLSRQVCPQPKPSSNSALACKTSQES